MLIQWFGHSCFRLEDKETSILIDPFDKEIGLRPPKTKDPVVLSTHGHYDHASLSDVSTDAVVITGPGEYEAKGVSVRGIKSFHDNTQGSERGLNTIYVITIEDITICHLGDLGQEKLEEEQVDQIGDVDILMIPVGGVYTIDGKQAAEIIGQIEPKIIIPMHFKVPGLKIDIAGPEKFIKEIGLVPEKMDKLRVAKKTLPQEEMKLVMFAL